VLTVRARTTDDLAAVTALLAAAAERAAAADPRLPPARPPGDGPALVAVDAAGTVHGHVRPVAQELAEDDDARLYAPDRSVTWADAAADGPDAVRALAAAVRATGPGAAADAVLWPAVEAGWWAAADLTPAGVYALRPPDPLPGPLPPGVTARPGTAADADAVAALHDEAVAFQAAASPYVRHLPSAAAGFRRRLVGGESASTVLAAGDRLVGVCEWWPVAAGQGPPLPAGRYVYLNSVAVTAAARSAGLGRALVAAALAAAGGDLDGSTLWFSPQNPVASRVWPHLGWRPLWTAWERRAG
jgi:GNAT superfamily N-acetyltransferase